MINDDALVSVVSVIYKPILDLRNNPLTVAKGF